MKVVEEIKTLDQVKFPKEFLSETEIIAEINKKDAEAISYLLKTGVLIR